MAREYKANEDARERRAKVQQSGPSGAAARSKAYEPRERKRHEQHARGRARAKREEIRQLGGTGGRGGDEEQENRRAAGESMKEPEAQ